MSLIDASGLALTGRLEGTALRLAAGTLTCLIGPNGSGKTSLLHALAGIGRASGRVLVDGMEVRSAPLSARPRLLTYLPATRDLRWPIAARDLVALGGACTAHVAAAMAKMDLTSLAVRPVDSLSTGERSRVLIARALAPGPRLLLLDEPTANLDPLWQIRLMELVRAELAGGDRAALVAMHDLDAAVRFADRLIVMSGGRIAADGEPAEVIGASVIREVFGVERRGGDWVQASA